MKLAAVDRANFKVFFKHRANMLTWGEHITNFLLRPAGRRLPHYCGIKPALATTLIDYGKNAENCNNVRQFILSSFQPALKRTGPVKQDAALALRGVCGGGLRKRPTASQEALGPKKKTEKQHIMAGWSFHPACFYRLKILKAPAPACPSLPHK